MMFGRVVCHGISSVGEIDVDWVVVHGNGYCGYGSHQYGYREDGSASVVYRGFGYRGGDYCRGSLRIIVGAIRESPLQGLSVMTITP